MNSSRGTKSSPRKQLFRQKPFISLIENENNFVQTKQIRKKHLQTLLGLFELEMEVCFCLTLNNIKRGESTNQEFELSAKKIARYTKYCF